MQTINPLEIRAWFHTIAMRAGIAALDAQFTTSIVKDTGGGGGITTQADLDAQEIVTSMLQDKFPGVPIVGEEGNTLTECPVTAFIVDPIDGSAPYKSRAPDWTTTIAYRSPEFTEGVIYQPTLDMLYITNGDVVECHLGSRPGGLRHVTPLRLIQPKKPQWRICCPVCREFSDEAWENVLFPLIKDKKVRAFENLSCNTVHFIRLFEGCDDAVIMWAKTWDSAAAIPMAKLLGITVADFNGNEPDLSIIEPQRLVFARGQEVLDFIIERTKHWPSPENELRK